MSISLPQQRPTPAACNGVVFVALFACVALQVAALPPMMALGLSPLIVGIGIGIFYGNTLRHHLPAPWVPGIVFSGKTILRLAVVLYGFRLTVQDIAVVGLEGFAAGAVMLTTTFALGAWVGIRVLGVPPRLALLIASGSAVCGAAAVLATEPVVKGRPHESGIAVGTVVLFGTLAMLLYPFAYRNGWLGPMDPAVYGLYAGSSLHEVAHVVAAGRAVSAEAANNAVIVKMLRVMMLVPLLIVVGWALRSRCATDDPAKPGGGGAKGAFPWFALGFILCAGFNSLHLLPSWLIDAINQVDLFLLTMAMCALGMETSLEKVRKVGGKPFVLAAILALWLAFGGYWVATTAHALLAGA